MFSSLHTPLVTIVLGWLVAVSLSTVHGAIHAEHPPADELVTTQNNSSFPLVSVMILTTLRGGRASLLLPLTLEQLESQMYENKEAVVVVQSSKSQDCDGETLRSLAALPSSDDGRRHHSFPVRLFCSLAPDASLGVMRNQAVAEAQGEIVAHWDDDDLHGPERLSLQVGQLLTQEKGPRGFVVALNTLPLSVLFDTARNRFVKVSRTVGDLATLVYWRRLAVAHPYGDTSFKEEMAMVSGSTETVGALVLDRYTALSLFIRVRHPRSATAGVMSPEAWNNAEPLVRAPTWIDKSASAQHCLTAVVTATKQLDLEPVEETVVPDTEGSFLNKKMGLAVFAREHHLVSRRVHAPPRQSDEPDPYEVADALTRACRGACYTRSSMLSDIISVPINGNPSTIVERLVRTFGGNQTVLTVNSLSDVLVEGEFYWVQQRSDQDLIRLLAEITAAECRSFDSRFHGQPDGRNSPLSEDNMILSERFKVNERGSAFCWREVDVLRAESSKYSSASPSFLALVVSRARNDQSTSRRLYQFEYHVLFLGHGSDRLVFSRWLASTMKRSVSSNNCITTSFGCFFQLGCRAYASTYLCTGCAHCGGSILFRGECPSYCGSINDAMCAAGTHRLALNLNDPTLHSNCLQCSFCANGPLCPFCNATGVPCFFCANGPHIIPSPTPVDLPTSGPPPPPPSPTPPVPTSNSSLSPSHSPTTVPTRAPTMSPTTPTSFAPTTSPTASQSPVPTKSPTGSPTARPSRAPTSSPTLEPTTSPTPRPSSSPTPAPSTSSTSPPLPSAPTPMTAQTSSPTPQKITTDPTTITIASISPGRVVAVKPGQSIVLNATDVGAGGSGAVVHVELGTGPTARSTYVDLTSLPATGPLGLTLSLDNATVSDTETYVLTVRFVGPDPVPERPLTDVGVVVSDYMPPPTGPCWLSSVDRRSLDSGSFEVWVVQRAAAGPSCNQAPAVPVPTPDTPGWLVPVNLSVLAVLLLGVGIAVAVCLNNRRRSRNREQDHPPAGTEMDATRLRSVSRSGAAGRRNRRHSVSPGVTRNSSRDRRNSTSGRRSHRASRHGVDPVVCGIYDQFPTQVDVNANVPPSLTGPSVYDRAAPGSGFTNAYESVQTAAAATTVGRMPVYDTIGVPGPPPPPPENYDHWSKPFTTAKSRVPVATDADLNKQYAEVDVIRQMQYANMRPQSTQYDQLPQEMRQ